MAVAGADPKAVISDRGWQTLTELAGGDPVSGEALSEQMNISRQAVWKHIQALRETGLQIDTEDREGYVLDAPIRFLDESRIRSGIESIQGAAHGEARIQRPEVTVLRSVDSTNSWLRRRADEMSVDAPWLVLAEHQTGGRGRRGRQWFPRCGTDRS